MTEKHDLSLQIVWDRLVAACEEQARALIRAGFSTAAREAADVSAGVFDTLGRMITQAETGTPGHINSMANSVRHFLEKYPLTGMRSGDAYITNDPWKATGHLSDFTVVSPVFRGGRAVALFACTTHVSDIGGIGPSPDARQIYAEGLQVPILPIATEGRMNLHLLEMVRANVREPIQVEGDIFALVACNEVGSRRLIEVMDEYGLADLEDIAERIFSQSRAAMQAAINALPRGTWRNHLRMDGYEAPIDLHAALTIKQDVIEVDLTGTSGPSNFGINCPLSYTQAYMSYGLKCLIAPQIPNNAATLGCFDIHAPEGCIANASFPRPVVGRAVIGMMMPDLVFGCFEQAVPGVVPAESAGILWNIRLGAGKGLSGNTENGITPFMITSMHGGGSGARPGLDGLAATPFPARVKNISVEVIELMSPLVIWKKEYRQDSGGPGRQRGGLGQSIHASNREPYDMTFFPRYERVENPARGVQGGGVGATGIVRLGSGQLLRAKGAQLIPAGEIVVIDTPGGGGHGSAEDRDPDLIARDLEDGLISPEAALRDYGYRPAAAAE